MRRNRVRILGIGIDSLDMGDAVKAIEEFVSEPGCHQIVTANSEMIVQALEDEELSAVIEKADLVVADGAGVLWAGRIFGMPFPGRVPGIELMDRLLQVAERKGHDVFLLGAEDGVAVEAAKKLKRKYPRLGIVGTHHGYFHPEQNTGVVEAINSSGAQMLFVALGASRQEKWIAANRGHLCCRVAMGVGGSLDVYAGKARRAPRWMGELGLEWLYRLIREPWRYRRMFAIPRFMFLVLSAKWTGRYKL